MKNKILGIWTWCKEKEIPFYCSLAGPLVMGTIHLASCIMHFDWITLNYCIFAYLMGLVKVWQWAIEKFSLKPSAYVAAAISTGVILAPMMASFILTIHFKEAPTYPFQWLAYLYAFYGTVKLIFAIKNLLKKEKTPRTDVIAWVGLLGALYTIQMMQFRLIMIGSGGKVSESMYFMQLFTQGVIFLFAVFTAARFIYREKKRVKK